MKRILAASILGLLVAGCADAGRGGAADNETGRASSIEVTEPGVAPEPGTTPTISTGYVAETPAVPSPIPPESAVQPQPEPERVQTPESTPADQPDEVGDQGAQLTPEPQTGDDANPDTVNPRP